MASLNVLAPDIEPWATNHIQGMIAIGQSLERKGYAYVTKDGLYFQVDQMADYGKLSGRKQEDNEAGARVAAATARGRLVYELQGGADAIGALGVIMLLSMTIHVPEIVTGLIGVAFIAWSLVSSIRHDKRVETND